MPKSSVWSGLALSALLFGAAAPLVGCEDPAVVEAANSAATTILLDANSRLADSKTLLIRLPKRLDSLAKDVPEVEALRAQQTEYQATLTQLEAKFERLEKDLEKIAKQGKKSPIDQFGETLKVEFTGADQFAVKVSELAGRVTALEQAAAAAAAAAAPKEALTPFARTLSTGFEVKAFTEGVEHHLLTFLDDPNAKLDEAVWYNFDRLTFAANGIAVDVEKSKPQLDNVAAIMKAFPKLKLKIGDYTDNSGDQAASKKLSAERANSLRQSLINAGADDKRLEAEGFGAERPVCAANDTDECKAQNRRIAVHVTEK